MRLSYLFLFLVFLAACTGNKAPVTVSSNNTAAADSLFSAYWEERAQLFPLDATANGDYRYNDRLTITISNSFRDSLKDFYRKYSGQLEKLDTTGLDAEHQMSCRLMAYELNMGMEGLKFPTHYLPMNQFWSLCLDMPVLGSGKGNQPFRNAKDYEMFLGRMSQFPVWADTAIANMKEGMKQGWVLPKALVVKVLPQLKAMLVPAMQSTFYGSIKEMPDSISSTDRERLTKAYVQMIDSQIVPAYRRLYEFMSGPYMVEARSSSGIGAIPQGADYYNYLIRYWTTTSLTPDSIYNLGLAEVAHIESEMNRVREESGFKGDMQAFFKFLNTDKQFFPFKTPQDVLDSFKRIKAIETPGLSRLFHQTPKYPFQIRQTEAFRAASASAEYNPPSEDGSRPGIFYVPIIDALKYNAVGMETLFLHEAIPGHHYQIALQQENKDLPKFRRFLWYGAYGEGWAHYSESLGKELGLYTNPYQYFGHLSDAMHRAIRLVVDVGLHSKGMTREQAIDYMLAHEATTREGATAEVERYMAIPGQALSYRIGALAIGAERVHWQQELGNKFNIADFHDEVLKHGCVPLNILSENLNAWATHY
jgi:uncharacterized protein (DUF885 family)